MKKTYVNGSTMLGIKGFLILAAFGIWIYVILSNQGSFKTAFEALLLYGRDTLIVIMVFYTLLLLLEFFVGVRDTEK